MEYTKDTEKFSFGIGSTTAAGTGNLADAQPVEGKSSKQEIAETALSAAAVLGITLFKLKFGKKKGSRKNKAKKKKK